MLGAHAAAQALGFQPVEQARHGAWVDGAFACQLGHGVGMTSVHLVQGQPLRHGGRNAQVGLFGHALADGQLGLAQQQKQPVFGPIVIAIKEGGGRQRCWGR